MKKNIFLSMLCIILSISLVQLYAQDVEVKLGGTENQCFKVVDETGETLFFIKADGTVGEQLNANVVGTFKYANSSKGAGKILTSDADGNATWVDPSFVDEEEDNMQPYLALRFCIKRRGDDVGRIALFAYNVAYGATTDWLLCDGQTTAEFLHPELFQVIGQFYGGTTPDHGTVTFVIPDLRGRVPMHYYDNPLDEYFDLTKRGLGEKGGVETHN